MGRSVYFHLPPFYLARLSWNGDPGGGTSPLTPSATRAQVLAARAWEHRRFPSEPEARLWRELSAGKLCVVFRRQVVLANGIVATALPWLSARSTGQ
jgi:hypothetical protein